MGEEEEEGRNGKEGRMIEMRKGKIEEQKEGMIGKRMGRGEKNRRGGEKEEGREEEERKNRRV